MAFSVQFCYTSDPPNTLGKTFGESAQTKICSPYEPLSDFSGKIIIDYDEGIEGYNYAVIYEGGSSEHPQHEGRPRSCFITDIEKLPGGKMAVYVEVDVLETYKDDIKSMEILATRASVAGEQGGNVGYNSMLEDGMWKCDSTSLYWLSKDLMSDQFNYDRYDGNTLALTYIVMTAG